MAKGLNSRDLVIAPVASVEATVAAIAQRASQRSTDFTIGRTFTHLTTAESTAIPVDIALGLTTSTTIAGLIAASTALADRLNYVSHICNRLVYILEVNGFTSGTT